MSDTETTTQEQIDITKKILLDSIEGTEVAFVTKDGKLYRIPVELLRGNSVLLQFSEENILQYRYTEDEEWTDIFYFSGIVEAEELRVTSEENRVTSESSRVSAETSRSEAEAARVSAENTRNTAETNRTNAESSRSDAEDLRQTAETSREGAEISRSDAEGTRVSAETARRTAETSRSEAEETRASAEATRKTSENSRVSAETSRVNAESSRQTAESDRASNESTRQNQETTRQDNETSRQASISELQAKGDYSPSTAYKKNNTVLYSDGCGYMCIQNTSAGTAPGNTTYWKKIAQKGTDGQGAGDMLASTYDTDGDGKVDSAEVADTANALSGTATISESQVSGLTSKLSAKAPLASPALIGSPTAPTQDSSDDSAKIATTAFVQALVNTLIGSAPSTLNTLAEIADAINDDANLYTTLTTLIGQKLAKSSNLSDLTNAATARTNLGLGAVALLSSIAISNVTGLSTALDAKIESITKAMVEAVLKGTITSHTHPFGTSTGTFCQGNDLRLSNTRTPLDTSVTYAKVAYTLKNFVTLNSGSVNLSTAAGGKITLTANTAFSFSGFELNKTYLLIISANGYTPSWNDGTKHVPVDGNAELGDSGTFYISLTCIDATAGSEKLLTAIMKEGE